VPLLELAFDLLHGVQSNAHDDQNRGATEGEVLIRIQEDERN
jgi:hypothetical protein